MSSLRPEFRKLFAVFILAVFLGALWSVLISPVMTGFTLRQNEIGEARFLLAKYEALALRRESAANALASAQAVLQGGGEFLIETSAPLASAALQRRVRTIVSANSAAMPAARSLPGVEENGLTLVTLRVTISGDLEDIYKTLHKIESNVPYLMIDNLHLRPVRGQSEGDTISLEANFDIIGALAEAERQ